MTTIIITQYRFITEYISFNNLNTLCDITMKLYGVSPNYFLQHLIFLYGNNIPHVMVLLVLEIRLLRLCTSDVELSI